METSVSTIAFVTDDGSTISSHFGRAMYYEIITLDQGKVTGRNRVDKAGHHSFSPEMQAEHNHHDANKHAVMTAPLTGVQILVARGMGMGAWQHLTDSGVRPILTDIHTIDEAVAHYLAGTLADNPQRLHNHGPHHQ